MKYVENILIKKWSKLIPNISESDSYCLDELARIVLRDVTNLSNHDKLMEGFYKIKAKL